jgi:Domain of unknown function (DUF4253)
MALTPDETELLNDVGFDPLVVEHVRSQTRGPLERVRIQNIDGNELGPGISVGVADGEAAEKLMLPIQLALIALGYRAFWSMRHEPNGMRMGDEVVILKGTDQYAMVRLCQTNGSNIGISTDDIIDRLNAWRKICDFDVVGASSDWVAIQFARLPADLCEFAQEVFIFCPDINDSVGRRGTPADDRAAMQICPDVTVPMKPEIAQHFQDLDPELSEQLTQAYRSEVEMNIRHLALGLREKKYLFLWWD